MTDSGAETLVIEAGVLDEISGALEVRELAAFARPIVVGGAGDWEALAVTPAGDFVPAREPELDDLINIQYTSGTTGFPKGCMLSHRYWLTLGRVAAMRANGIVKHVIAGPALLLHGPAMAAADGDAIEGHALRRGQGLGHQFPRLGPALRHRILHFPADRPETGAAAR
jgi:acyl-CoA synthetase (AMP-forming)/AMP-acid ligase II